MTKLISITSLSLIESSNLFDYRGNIKRNACPFSLGYEKHPTGHFQLPVRMH